MPRAAQHAVGGAIAAGVVNVMIQLESGLDDPGRRFDWGELLLCCAAGAGAGLLPDLLEPADSPNHRLFFHSLAAAGIVAWAISGKHTGQWTPEMRKLLLAAGFGYLSHLYLDGLTPKSINII